MTQTALAKREEKTKVVAAFLMDEQRLAKLQKMLPPQVNANTLVRVFLNSLIKNDKLLEASIGNQASLWESLVEASSLGLRIGGPQPQGYLVPYGRAVQFQLSYHGLIDLVQRTGELDKIVAVDVRDGEPYVVNDDPLASTPIQHKKSAAADRHKKPITHVWAGAAMKNGTRFYLSMSRAEIDDHKKRYSQGWDRKGSAWKDQWEAMAKKTVLIRLIKEYHLPMSLDDQRRDHYLGQDVVVAKNDQGEITAGQEWDMFANYAAQQMAKATDLTAVNTIVDTLNDEYQGEHHAKYIFELAETKREAIRSARGENSSR